VPPRAQQAHDGLDGGGLAHAVAAQQVALARRHRQVHAEQHLAGAVAGDLDFEQVH
jgi:hypothetical protein